MDKERLKNIPELPGVYIMKDKKGDVLYIGKAASLRKRVSSHFQRGPRLSPRIRVAVDKVAELSYIVTGTEAEALITESALIKEYRPRYNVALRDDKSYPYLKLTINEEFPRLMITRKKRILSADAKLKGPTAAEEKAVFYGPYTDVKLLRKALSIMKRIFPLRTCKRMPKKACLNHHIGQCYAPCIGAIDGEAYADIVGELKLFLTGKKDKLIDELSKKMRIQAAKRNYEKAAVFRDRMIALSVVPETVRRARHKNAAYKDRDTAFMKRMRPYDEIIALRFILGLKRVPRKIEAFDISDIGGKEAVGSVITFLDGNPSKDDYRRFKIRNVTGIDDCKMMQEIVRRRYERVKAERLPCPDLIIIDGGKGQLNAASSILEDLGFERIPVIGIAKRFERIYVKGRKEPIIFSQESPLLHLIQRLRDEAHRFAINYHHILRSKKLKRSILDKIDGVGEKRKGMLLNKFGSVLNIKKAGIEELRSLKGIDAKTAGKIKSLLS